MTPIPQDLDALQIFLDAQGGDSRRWPPGVDAALAPWFARDPAARALLNRAIRLDALIADAFPPQAAAFDPARVAAAAEGRAQERPSRSGIRPWTLLRPAAAMAASLALGFLVGAAGMMPAPRTAPLSAPALDAGELAALAAEAFALDDAL